ncbi:MAG: cytochrome b6-f complex iron-sulfur subunit [Anaerolineae bacterium]|nr:cytochrome b6-f complex iron-sulfur subunit [Gloeobacterales cyanobacterium ES-bin-313]
MSESTVGEIPMGRRQLLSYVTGGAIAATTVAALYPVVSYFIPPGGGGAGGGTTAKDKAGNDILVDKLLAGAQPSSRVISLGPTVKGGDATYIVINDQKQIGNYGINAVCTHLGCVVPWDQGSQMFKCPCHGSQYNADGGLVHGPAPQPLPLVKAEAKDNKIVFTAWTENDFRKTDLWSDPKPYWVE